MCTHFRCQLLRQCVRDSVHGDRNTLLLLFTWYSFSNLRLARRQWCTWQRNDHANLPYWNWTLAYEVAKGRKKLTFRSRSDLTSRLEACWYCSAYLRLSFEAHVDVVEKAYPRRRTALPFPLMHLDQQSSRTSHLLGQWSIPDAREQDWPGP